MPAEDGHETVSLPSHPKVTSDVLKLPNRDIGVVDADGGNSNKPAQSENSPRMNRDVVGLSRSVSCCSRSRAAPGVAAGSN